MQLCMLESQTCAISCPRLSQSSLSLEGHHSFNMLPLVSQTVFTEKRLSPIPYPAQPPIVLVVIPLHLLFLVLVWTIFVRILNQARFTPSTAVVQLLQVWTNRYLAQLCFQCSSLNPAYVKWEWFPALQWLNPAKTVQITDICQMEIIWFFTHLVLFRDS